MDLYQVCSNYASGVKSGPAPGVTRNMASFQQIQRRWTIKGHLTLLFLKGKMIVHEIKQKFKIFNVRFFNI